MPYIVKSFAKVRREKFNGFAINLDYPNTYIFYIASSTMHLHNFPLSDMRIEWNLKDSSTISRVCKLYKDFSNARAIICVTLIPRNSILSFGISTLGNGLMFVFF